MNIHQKRTQVFQRMGQKISGISRSISFWRVGLMMLSILLFILTYRETLTQWVGVTITTTLFIGFLFIVRSHRQLSKKEIQWKNRIRFALHLESIVKRKVQPKLSEPEFNEMEIAKDLGISGKNGLFHLLDLAITDGGRNLLATYFSTNPSVEEINERQKLIQRIEHQSSFIIRYISLRFSEKEKALNFESILLWLHKLPNELHQHQWRKWLWVPALTATSLAVFGIFAETWVFILSALGLNLLLIGLTSGIINQWLESGFYHLSDLRSAKTALDLLATSALPKELKTFSTQLKKDISSLDRISGLAETRKNPLFYLLISMIFSLDTILFILLYRWGKQASTEVPDFIQQWYQTDALISIAAFNTIHEEFSYPTISNQSGMFQATTIGHPFLPQEKRIYNEFKLSPVGTLFLITGSNMAGKTTFMRTIGCNIKLAMLGAKVCGKQVTCSPMEIYSSIVIEDSIADGYSYFYMQVKRMRNLLDHLEKATIEKPLLYLVDEIFSGTNAIERQIASQKLLSKLIQFKGIGMISTHDLNLTEMAGEFPDQIILTHFSEKMQAGELVFDYLLKPGPVKTTNALAILEREGVI